MPRSNTLAVLLVAALYGSTSVASDWPRFRGAGGSGVSSDSKSLPTTWSDTENLSWKVDLPGPGLSSPIVVGDRVFVTSWTGYAAGPDSSESQEDLKRALVCVDRHTGEILWTSSVDSVLPEDEYTGMFAQNGYASHTPASDGERVYCFFGKTGVAAFDLEGQKLWQTSVGTGREPRGWGSASSPVLYNNLVIVTAAAESESLVALDKATGEVVWNQQAESLAGTWSTPVLVDVDQQRTDLVLSVPYELWGLNPETGKLRWFAESVESDTNSVTSSVVVKHGADPVAYVVGGRSGGAVAIKVGGTGDVSESHVLWREDHRGRIGSPVVHENRLYWVAGGVANCVDADSGDRIYQERLRGSSGGGRGGDYSSPIIADGKLYYMSRGGDGFVIKLGDEFEQLAVNRFDSDEGEYSATPAASNGQLFIRSTKTLYCVAE